MLFAVVKYHDNDDRQKCVVVLQISMGCDTKLGHRHMLSEQARSPTLVEDLRSPAKVRFDASGSTLKPSQPRRMLAG
jgi:hypothetical protein